MQDRYAGDVGDFGKFGMLRKIADSGLCIGVNWYLSFKPEEHNRDAYTDAKEEFVSRYSEIGKMQYGERYKPK